YNSDQHLSDAVTRFLGEGLRAGAPVIVIATKVHRDLVTRQLREQGLDVQEAVDRGCLVLLDARETLDGFMVDGMPDEALFSERAGRVVETTRRALRQGRLRAYGEMVDVLYREGNPRAALALEMCWNRLAERHSFSLLCTYSMGTFQSGGHSDRFDAIC